MLTHPHGSISYDRLPDPDGFATATDLPLGMAASECCTSGRKRHFFNSTLHLPSENCVVQRNTADVEEKCCPIPKSIESIAILNGIQHHAIKHAAYFAGILLDWCALKEISLHDLHENCFAARRLHFLQGNLLICICATTISRFKKMRHLCNCTPDVLQKCRTCKWSCCFKRRLHFFANTVLGNASKRNDCCVFWGHTELILHLFANKKHCTSWRTFLRKNTIYVYIIACEYLLIFIGTISIRGKIQHFHATSIRLYHQTISYWKWPST